MWLLATWWQFARSWKTNFEVEMSLEGRYLLFFESVLWKLKVDLRSCGKVMDQVFDAKRLTEGV